MMRLDGRYNGQQIVPASVVATIRKGASRDAFAAAGYDTMAGWSYRDQWWIAHDAHGTFMARGIHGQNIWVDPTARVVIARFGSHPLASTVNFDPIALPAYRAVADRVVTPALTVPRARAPYALQSHRGSVRGRYTPFMDEHDEQGAATWRARFEK
jgi:CubicO group peptidase (beta-lactamase class C family)